MKLYQNQLQSIELALVKLSRQIRAPAAAVNTTILLQLQVDIAGNAASDTVLASLFSPRGCFLGGQDCLSWLIGL